MAEAATKIEEMAAKLGLTMEAKFVPWSLSRNAGENQPSLNWKVTLVREGRRVLTTDYMSGCAHCPSYKQDRLITTKEVVRWECENGKHGQWSDGQGRPKLHVNMKPIMPVFADVLHSLAMDSDALDCPTFEEWAEDNGYDEDSRKAETTYRACLEIALKLRAALGEAGLAELREACSDY